MAPIRDKRCKKTPPKLFQLLQKIRLACAFFDLFVPLSITRENVKIYLAFAGISICLTSLRNNTRFLERHVICDKPKNKRLQEIM